MCARSATLLLVQRDVTERAQLENTLSELTEAQLAMLSQIFPRHVIEALSMGNSDNISVEQVAALAHSHRDVTVLVMDLVGFTSMSKVSAPMPHLAVMAGEASSAHKPWMCADG